MTSKKKILLVGEHAVDDVRKEELSKKFIIEEMKLVSREQVIEEFKSKHNDIHAMSVNINGFGAVGNMNTDLLEALPASLEIIAIPSVGYDHYDHKGLAEKGIVLTNSPGMSAPSVAEIAVYLALSTFRYTTLQEHALRLRHHTLDARKAASSLDKQLGQIPKYGNERSFSVGHEIGNCFAESMVGRTAGIAGFGAIGKVIGHRLHSMGMRIHYYKRSPVKVGEIDYPAEFHSTFESLCKHSELLVLVLPLNEETKYLLNERTIALLPKGAKVVNVGRGPLIDESALVRALESGQISSAGLDVFEKEPKVHPDLLSRYDVTLLPHLGGSTIDAIEAATENTLKNIENVIVQNGRGLHRVN